MLHQKQDYRNELGFTDILVAVVNIRYRPVAATPGATTATATAAAAATSATKSSKGKGERRTQGRGP